jgi:hypothetical protein
MGLIIGLGNGWFASLEQRVYAPRFDVSSRRYNNFFFRPGITVHYQEERHHTLVYCGIRDEHGKDSSRRLASIIDWADDRWCKSVWNKDYDSRRDPCLAILFRELHPRVERAYLFTGPETRWEDMTEHLQKGTLPHLT